MKKQKIVQILKVGCLGFRKGNYCLLEDLRDDLQFLLDVLDALDVLKCWLKDLFEMVFNLFGHKC